MDSVLEGIRVLDWTQFQAGPVGTMLLGDLGADVIKIEERIGGDRARGVFAVGGNELAKELSRRNPYFEIGNRNKRGITIDMAKESGKQIIYKLVERSDVFVHNFRNKTVERLGMGYETLSKYNPQLIYAHTSGWGPKGPEKDSPSFDPAAMARSGFWSLLFPPNQDPIYPQGGVADQMGGMTTTLGILAALMYRERTGKGQKVDASILGGMTYLVAYPMNIFTMCGLPPINFERKNPINPLYNIYKSKDDKWIALVLVPPDKYWADFCRAMGTEELEKDPRFDSIETRQQNAQELIAVLDDIFASRTAEEWTRILNEYGMVFSVMNTVDEYVNDPQALANDYVTHFNHPVWGDMKTMGFPVGLSKTPCSIRREAPEFGQHTEEILLEVLDYSWDDIAKLKDEEII